MKIEFVYKCRMCGELFAGCFIGGVSNAKALGMICDTMYDTKKLDRPVLWVSHSHKDGVGIADLVGFRERLEEA